MSEVFINEFIEDTSNRLARDAEMAEYLDYVYGKYCQNISELANYIRKGVKQ